ncbi:MAG: bifunctional riboflavin kinase/FAD synthetase [Pseudomonadota bacterium]
MRTVRDPSVMDPALRGASAAIGNFDGVHLGHQHVLDLARGRGGLAVVTFEPHPRAFFGPKDAAPFRLMNAEAKTNRLEKLGVDLLFELPFDAALAGLKADEFAGDILGAALGLKHVVVGADFRFGKSRTGTAEALRDMGHNHGFDVTIAELLTSGPGAVSSTAIRAALSEGAPARAAEMLGHWHRIEGPVLHGAKRGRDLGYPTINMSLDGLHLPALGVYAVLVDVLDGGHVGSYHGVASLGIRPMFDRGAPNLETFIFNFTGDLYGATVSVALIEYIRPEAAFDGLEALIAQMDADSANARAILARL